MRNDQTKDIISGIKEIITTNFGHDNPKLSDDLSDDCLFCPDDLGDFIYYLERAFKIRINEFKAEELTTIKKSVICVISLI